MGDIERRPPRRVVVTALPLKRRQADLLAQQLGPDFRLVDIREAPERVDFVLCPPCSPQTVRRLCDTFPGARVVALELDDAETGIRVEGPVGRTLSGGASGYFVAASGYAVGDFLTAATAATSLEEDRAAALPVPTVDDVLLAQIEDLAARRADPA